MSPSMTQPLDVDQLLQSPKTSADSCSQPTSPSTKSPALLDKTQQHCLPATKQVLLVASVKWPELVYMDDVLDLWTLEYVESSLNDKLTCSICQCIFVEPYSTKCG